MNQLFLDAVKAQKKTKFGTSPDIQGFAVGPTINPCTKGIWIWNEILRIRTDPSNPNSATFPCLVIDTEGLAATDQDTNHDTKVFMLAMLLSSMLIYNSHGAISETALNNMDLVLRLCKEFLARNDGIDE